MRIIFVMSMSTALTLGLVSGCDSPPQATDVGTAPSVATPKATDPPMVAKGVLSLTDRSAAVASADGGYCSLDALNGAPATAASFEAGSEVVFSGWIADAQKQVPTDARLILQSADRAYAIPLIAGGERTDVAEILGTDALRFSGYSVLVRLEAEPGVYQLAITYGPEEEEASCALAPLLTITG